MTRRGTVTSRKLQGGYIFFGARKALLKRRFGNNIVTNGTFHNNIDGWTLGASAGAISWNAGKLRIVADGTGSTYVSADQTLPTTVGTTYTVSVGAVPTSGSYVNVLIIIDGNATYITGPTGTTTFTATSTSTQFQLTLAAAAAGYTVDFDNVIVKSLNT